MKKVIATNYNKCLHARIYLDIAFKIDDDNFSIPIKLYFKEGQKISIHLTVKKQMYNILLNDTSSLENKYIKHAILENNMINFINI